MRPILSKDLDPDIFLQYYYLGIELHDFCKENNIPIEGNKQNITKKIEHFLRTGEITKDKKVKIKYNDIDFNNLSLESIIEENFVCSEKHRLFFKSIIGNNFHFYVEFQKYLKNNSGKTYKDAINEYYKIVQFKKENKGNTKIDSQFEYNTYIRDFFKDNKDKTMKQAIKCWNYKKMKGGFHKYEKEDLSHIEE